MQQKLITCKKSVFCFSAFLYSVFIAVKETFHRTFNEISYYILKDIETFKNKNAYIDFVNFQFVNNIGALDNL